MLFANILWKYGFGKRRIIELSVTTVLRQQLENNAFGKHPKLLTDYCGRGKTWCGHGLCLPVCLCHLWRVHSNTDKTTYPVNVQLRPRGGDIITLLAVRQCVCLCVCVRTGSLIPTRLRQSHQQIPSQSSVFDPSERTASRETVCVD